MKEFSYKALRTEREMFEDSNRRVQIGMVLITLAFFAFLFTH